MSKLTLTICSINIEKIMKNRNYGTLSLNSFFADGANFCYTVRDFCSKYSSSIENLESQEKVFACSKIGPITETDRYTYYWGIINTGDYGIVSEIVDIHTGQPVFEKTADNADMMPFYFMVIVPKDYVDNSGNKIIVQKALLIIQNNGIYGIKTVLNRYLCQYISKEYGAKLNILNVTPKVYVDKLLDEGALEKIRFVINHPDEDISNSVGFSSLYEERTFIKPIITADLMSKIKLLTRNRNCVINEFEDINYDNIKLEIKAGNIVKTLNLNNIDNVNISESVPDEYKLADGTIAEDQFLSYVLQTADLYLNNMSLEIV